MTMSQQVLARSVMRAFGAGSTACAHHCHDQSGKLVQQYATRPNPTASVGDYAFEMTHSTVRFGEGVTAEVGMDLKNLRAKHTLVLTDPNVRNLHAFKAVAESLTTNGVKFSVFDGVAVEPTEVSFKAAIAEAKKLGADTFVAVGGGSTMDTAKAAALYAANPDADFLDFVTLPFGKNIVPPNPILPLIAVPTTAGTGSEATTVAIFDFKDKHIKSGIRHRALKPHLAIVDPLNVATMPRHVAIYSGFDVLCHALESYTVLPFTERAPRPSDPRLRPVYQGANPISDVWARDALNTIHGFFRRSVKNGANDREAQSRMLLASTFAGMGFGNAGVHLCHGLSYPISGQVKSFVSADYPPGASLIPHGLSVVTTACEDFKFTASANPTRHMEAAACLGFDTQNVSSEKAGDIISDLVKGYMSDFKVPNGLSALGFDGGDVEKLATSARGSGALKLSPREEAETLAAIAGIYERSLSVF